MVMLDNSRKTVGFPSDYHLQFRRQHDPTVALGNMCYYLSFAQYLVNEQNWPPEEVDHVLVAVRIRMIKHQRRSP